MDLSIRYKSISIYKNAAAALLPLSALLSCENDDAAEKCAEVFRAVAESDCDLTGEWIKKLILADDNVFSRKVARGERISDRLKAQVKAELATFKQLSLIKPDAFVTEKNKDYFPRFGFGGMSLTYERLLAHYLANGCGDISCGSAFLYRDGRFVPFDTGSVRLSDIKGYDEEKSELVENTKNFIAGRPSFHTLLCGNSGTGKSDTVRAIANEYGDKVKLIGLSASDLETLPALLERLRGLMQKYILFIDGLSFGNRGEKTSKLISTVESVLDCPCDNTILYVTSDFAPQEKEGGREELTLFDRFGLVITYLTPDTDGFRDILKQILRSRGIKWHDEYASIAELAALKKGGRSPRAAKQIADLIESNYAERRFL